MPHLREDQLLTKEMGELKRAGIPVAPSPMRRMPKMAVVGQQTHRKARIQAAELQMFRKVITVVALSPRRSKRAKE